MTSNKLIAILICSQILGATVSIAAPKTERCNPKGTENEKIGCGHNDNVAYANKLAAAYGKKLDGLWQKCAKDNPGPGSGGHSDRVSCYAKALEPEGKALNVPRK